MVKETTEGALFEVGSRRFCRAVAVASLGSKFGWHRYCGGPSVALSRSGEARSGQMPILLAKSPQRKEGAQQQKTKEPHPRQQQSFSCSALLPLPHQPTTQHKHRQYAYLQGTTFSCQKSCCNSSVPILHLLELESPRLLLTAQLESWNSELTRPLGCYHRRRDDLGLLRPQGHRQRHLRG